MKKISLFILIVTLIINVFAPFSLIKNSEGKLRVEGNQIEAADCVVLSAVWKPAGEQDKDAFYKDNATDAEIVVKTKDCVNAQGITLTVFEADTGISNDDALIDSGLLRKPIDIPSDNFTIRIELGEEECEAGLTLAVGYDCNLFFYIRQGDTTLYNSWNENGGRIYYECDTLCTSNAKFIEILNNGSDNQPVEITVKKEIINPSNTYKLLAPIGNLEEVRSSGGTCPGNPEMPNGIGCYLNIIFKVAIGLCAALAVIMIVVGGIQYMGNESVFGKTEAKSRIFSAILGLFIALGAFAILNTINPALTGKDGVDVDQVTIEIDEEEETEPVTTYYQVTGKTKICTSGYRDVSTYGNGTIKQPKKINICNNIAGINIADNLQSMINEAKKAGIVLSGYGSRSYDRQVQLRKNHGCKPDIYTSPAKSCKPPTARPGHSNHEVGGAVDFTCNGQSMVEAGGRNSVCFKWLEANAGKYKFKNLASESWHWSFNGK